jgi:hypothetical protein
MKPPELKAALAARGASIQEREPHRVGPNRATWPSVFTENPYERPELGPRFWPTLCDFCQGNKKELLARLLALA